MRCETCDRHIHNQYDHAEFDCANWPERAIGQMQVEYKGYVIVRIPVQPICKYSVALDGAWVETVGWWTDAFELIDGLRCEGRRKVEYG